MWLTFALGEFFARLLLVLLPRRWSDRIRSNCAESTVFVYRTGQVQSKRRIATLIEGVGATLLFDLALFGTDNCIINGFIRLFTNLQNKWDRPFGNQQEAETAVMEFCTRLGIQQDPWIWEKSPSQYVSLNDFFSRQYHPNNKPSLGNAPIVAPACCTLTCYRDNEGLQSLLIKACAYRLDRIGLPANQDLDAYARNHILLGYLSPRDYHRVHAPVAGKCTHLKLQHQNALSASVKFFGGKFNVLNENKRLVVVLEVKDDLWIALVIVGGVGVNTIVYDPNMLGRTIDKGQELATFRAGGSAIVLLSNRELLYKKEFLVACENERPVEVLMGESLADLL